MLITLSQTRQSVFRVDRRPGGRQMTDSQDQCDGRPVIMVYVPIFREKLAKLERRGDGHTPEAVRLRRTLARIDLGLTKSRSCDDRQIRLTAAE
tara:strand:- start:2531 stop:2812 length:282 start_codon:yes stop_codon:yes gene_type:complete